MSSPLDRNHLELFRTWIGRHLGLHFESEKQDWLAEILAGRLQQSRCADWSTYLRRWDNDSTFQAVERAALAELLTVGETFFFRNNDQFRALVEVVFPARAAATPPPQPLRVLSAGCASGEEPYTVAILAREHAANLGGKPVIIDALDLNPRLLARGTAGEYSSWSLRQTPEAIGQRYFRPAGKNFRLAPELLGSVVFREANLVDPIGPLGYGGGYDVIFCRNVLMYFTPPALRVAIGRLTAALVPGGYLFLGHAETLRGLTHEFLLCSSHDTFYYQHRLPGTPIDTRLTLATEYRAPVQSAAGTPAKVVPDSASWFEVIDNASRQIRKLAGTPSAAGQAPEAPAPGGSSAGAAAITLRAQADRTAVAMELLREERFDEALSHLHAPAGAAPSDPDQLLLVGVLLINAGRIDEGEQICRTLLARDDLNAGGHYLLALCHEQRGQLPAAIQHNQTAIYLDGSFAMPQLHLGLIARRSGDRAGAIRALQQAQLLLAREDASRILLFGGGFGREALVEMCTVELRGLGGGA